MDALEISNLKKSFGDKKVIQGLTMNVPEHSVFGFLGQNGAGKTTTMKMVLGLLKPDEGEVKVFGQEVQYGQTKTNRMIGYLPDVPEFYGYLTTREYLYLCGDITGVPKQDLKRKIEELLELVGLAGEKKRIAGFSRGMKQRLGIAQALLHEPKLLICDEPTSALDPVGRKDILDILSRVKEQTTVIFSTHILSDVERICDEVAIIHEGKVAVSGSLEVIKAKHIENEIRIEFFSPEDYKVFSACQLPSSCGKQLQDTAFSMRVRVKNVYQAQKELMNLLHENNLVPMKLEVLEPSLENLFMEVVR